MTTIYMLQHVYRDAAGENSTKIIGFYTSLEKAHEAAFALQKQPGFEDHPTGFEVYYPIELDKVW
jgi:hypothetical protein